MEERPVVDIAPIGDMLERLSVRSAFGEPIQEGDTTLIPVANRRLWFWLRIGLRPGAGQKTRAGPDKPAEEEFTRGDHARRG